MFIISRGPTRAHEADPRGLQDGQYDTVKVGFCLFEFKTICNEISNVFNLQHLVSVITWSIYVYKLLENSILLKYASTINCIF